MNSWFTSLLQTVCYCGGKGVGLLLLPFFGFGIKSFTERNSAQIKATSLCSTTEWATAAQHHQPPHNTAAPQSAAWFHTCTTALTQWLQSRKPAQIIWWKDPVAVPCYSKRPISTECWSQSNPSKSFLQIFVNQQMDTLRKAALSPSEMCFLSVQSI